MSLTLKAKHNYWSCYEDVCLEMFGKTAQVPPFNDVMAWYVFEQANDMENHYIHKSNNISFFAACFMQKYW